MPSSLQFQYLPVNGYSVPFSLQTSYCSFVNSCFHSSLVFDTILGSRDAWALSFCKLVLIMGLFYTYANKTFFPDLFHIGVMISWCWLRTFTYKRVLSI